LHEISGNDIYTRLVFLILLHQMEMGLGTSSGVTYEALSLQNNFYMKSTTYKIWQT